MAKKAMSRNILKFTTNWHQTVVGLSTAFWYAKKKILSY